MDALLNIISNYWPIIAGTMMGAGWLWDRLAGTENIKKKIHSNEERIKSMEEKVSTMNTMVAKNTGKLDTIIGFIQKK